MGKRAFQIALYSLAGALLLLNNALLVYEVRSALHIAPRAAMIVGAVMVAIAIFLVVRAND